MLTIISIKSQKGDQEMRYEIYNDSYAGSPVKIIDTDTDRVVKQWDTWQHGHMAALDQAKRECARLNAEDDLRHVCDDDCRSYGCQGAFYAADMRHRFQR
jgi:hypothetical protein